MPISGTVTNIESREAKTKFGIKPVYDIYVDGNKYSWGFKDPSKSMVSVGSIVEFDTTSDKYGMKVTDSTVKVIKAGSGAAPTTPSPVRATSTPASGYRDMGFPVPVTSEKISIIRQNAVTNARELVNSFSSNWGIDTVTTGQEIVKIVLDVAREFADYTSGSLDRDAAERIVEKMSKEG